MPGQIELTLDATGGHLSNPGTTSVGNLLGRTAHWTMDPRIGSFRIEKKFSTGYYPFSRLPPTDFLNDVELTVPVFGGTGEWDYNVVWKTASGAPGPTLDPKIAVNPILPFSLAATLLIAVVGITGMVFLGKRVIRSLR